MSFKIKDGVQIGAKNVFNNTGQLVAPIEVDDPNTAFTLNLGLAANLTGDRTINFPNASGTVALGTINDGTLTLNIGTAAATNNAITVSAGTGFSANASSNATYSISVGPALTNLAALMTTAGAGFIRRGATADTYTIDTNTYLTAEADTLATVTGRGATTASAVSITNNTASTTTGTGALTVAGGVGIGGNLNVGGNLIISGTTTTVNSTTTTLDDPIITLGGDTPPATDDNKDRGVEFRWHNGSAAKIGFFGFDDSSGKLTFIPDATNSSEVFSGTVGEIDATIAWSNVTGDTTVGSNLVTLANPGAISYIKINADNTVTTRDAPNFRTDLGATTVGSNLFTLPNPGAVSFLRINGNNTVTAQSASDLKTDLGATTAGNSLFTLANPGAVSFLRINADNTASALDAATFRTAIGAGTGTGTVTSVATGTGLTGGAITSTGTIALTGQALAFHNLATNGIVVRTGADTVTARLIVAGNSNITVTNPDGIAGNPTISATFSTVNNDLTLQSGGTNTADLGVANTTVSTTAVTAVDSFAIATFRAAKYLVQITQGSTYQVSEVLVLHNGTTTTMTEYAVQESNSALATLTSDISSGNCRLLVTLASAATAATIRVYRTYMRV